MDYPPVLIRGEWVDLIATPGRVHLVQLQFWDAGTYYGCPNGVRRSRFGAVTPFIDLLRQRQAVLAELWAHNLTPRVNAAVIVPDDVRVKGMTTIHDTAIVTQTDWEDWVATQEPDLWLENTVRDLLAPKSTQTSTDYALAGLVDEEPSFTP